MFFIFSKNNKSKNSQIFVSSPEESDIPTWKDSDERELQDLRRRAGGARDQIIWIQNQISYFSYELSKATDEDAKAENQQILSGWEKRMEYQKILLRNALTDQEPLLEKKERFEKYYEDKEEDDE